MDIDIRKICKNCMNYDAAQKVCTIRYTIHPNKVRTPMKRRQNQNGCAVFMFKP